MPSTNGKFSQFNQIITSLDTLRDVIGQPAPAVLNKVLDHLDDTCRDFIAQSPFIILASSGADDHLDVSPKGDPAGFVQVLDNKHLAIPDRPGNRRIDTFQNILERPQVGMIFIIPGKTETLRVGGEARIVRDLQLREQMTVNGRIPEFAIVVHVERVFIHCPKCMIRAHMWQPEQWPNHSHIATIGEAMVKHAQLDITPAELDAIAEKEGLTKLY